MIKNRQGDNELEDKETWVRGMVDFVVDLSRGFAIPSGFKQTKERSSKEFKADSNG